MMGNIQYDYKLVFFAAIMHPQFIYGDKNISLWLKVRQLKCVIKQNTQNFSFYFMFNT